MNENVDSSIWTTELSTPNGATADECAALCDGISNTFQIMPGSDDNCRCCDGGNSWTDLGANSDAELYYNVVPAGTDTIGEIPFGITATDTCSCPTCQSEFVPNPRHRRQQGGWYGGSTPDNPSLRPA